MTTYFADAKFDEHEPLALRLRRPTTRAPATSRKHAQGAAKRGLDPDIWFNNVEVVTAERIGIETTTYVRNIYKYYVSYRLMLDAHQAQKEAREQVTPGTK